MANALVLRRWKFLFYFYFKGTLSWILQKMFFHHLSPDYWYCGRELVKCCTLSSTNGTGECAAHHSMVLERFSAS
jgi:hypothetical protein